MQFGLDYLGGCKYSDVILKSHPRGWHAGFFTEIFGDAVPTISKLLATGKCPGVRLNLSWRDNHKYSVADFAKIEKEAKRIAPLIKKFPHIKFQICGATEHDYDSPEATTLAKKILKILPTVTYVNTPLHGHGALINTAPNIVNEFHGSTITKVPNGSNFSFDGSDCVDLDVEKFKKNLSNTSVYFWWTARFNGKPEAGLIIPREKRTCWPDTKLIESIAFLANPKGKTSISKGWLYKSHAENKGTADRRAEKPVLIISQKAKEIVLRTQKGQLVGTLAYYGTYLDGRYRYYSPVMGYELSKKAIKLSGSALCDVFVNGKKYATINPAFRDGIFR